MFFHVPATPLEIYAPILMHSYRLGARKLPIRPAVLLLFCSCFASVLLLCFARVLLMFCSRFAFVLLLFCSYLLFFCFCVVLLFCFCFPPVLLVFRCCFAARRYNASGGGGEKKKLFAHTTIQSCTGARAAL